MGQYTVMSYNVLNMKKMFRKGAIVPEAREKADALATTILRSEPHILGIVEASDKKGQIELFRDDTALSRMGYRIAKSPHRRGSQDLAYFYRDPFELESLDADYEFWDQWIEDVDHDGIKEVCEFERKPLEAVFRVKGTEVKLLVILVSGKSKGVFQAQDILNHQMLAVANRKRLLAQSRKIRRRVDDLMERHPSLPVMVMGDFNDDPGMDSYERMLGASSIETIMGSVYEPSRILHNVLWYMSSTERRKDLWTLEYPDLIIRNVELTKVWLDHIFVTPNMLDPASPLRYVMDSGEIGEKDEAARKASDHYPVSCRIEC